MVEVIETAVWGIQKLLNADDPKAVFKYSFQFYNTLAYTEPYSILLISANFKNISDNKIAKERIQ